MTKLVAIVGGIGSGKSVVARMVAAMGYDVYDCDSRAKALMDTDDSIKRRIADEVCAEAIVGSEIDRRRLSAVVFNNLRKLERLNSIVHESVRSDLRAWVSKSRGSVAFVETAILYQSGLDKMVDEVWEVTALEEERVRRVMLRNGMTAEEVRSRIKAQDDYVAERKHERVFAVVNDGATAVLPRVLELLS